MAALPVRTWDLSVLLLGSGSTDDSFRRVSRLSCLSCCRPPGVPRRTLRWGSGRALHPRSTSIHPEAADPEAARKLAVAVVVKADLPAADNQDNMAAANSSMAVVAADTADVFPAVHTICNNRNPIPNTNRRRLVSKSTDNIRSTTVRRRCRSASS